MAGCAFALLTCPAFYAGFLATATRAQAQKQEPLLSRLIGDWNHVGTGAVGGQDIHVVRTGNDTADVWQSDGPRARVAGGVIESGGNFAFEGKDHNKKNYRCVYYITFLADNLKSNWQLRRRAGKFGCPEGLYERVSITKPLLDGPSQGAQPDKANAPQSVNGNCNVAAQGVQGSTVTINAGCK